MVRTDGIIFLSFIGEMLNVVPTNQQRRIGILGNGLAAGV